VLELYKKAFSKEISKGLVNKVVKMEETLNKDAGSRFLLELVSCLLYTLFSPTFPHYT
jgi:hypothetical protein